MGQAHDMDPRLVDLTERLGFAWSGHWAGKGEDPMHFQYVTGFLLELAGVSLRPLETYDTEAI